MPSAPWTWMITSAQDQGLRAALRGSPRRESRGAQEATLCEGGPSELKRTLPVVLSFDFSCQSSCLLAILVHPENETSAASLGAREQSPLHGVFACVLLSPENTSGRAPCLPRPGQPTGSVVLSG